jgi:hypothetical protein
MPDAIQEFMEGYIPEFVPAPIRHHIDYFFDIYDAEEKCTSPDKTDTEIWLTNAVCYKFLLSL